MISVCIVYLTICGVWCFAGSRNLNGIVPTELGMLEDLKFLFLFDNPLLRGSLPAHLGNITSLVSFFAQENGLTGELPTELGKLGNIEKLNLARNNLTGSIPLEYSRMQKLVELDLSRNSLQGPIPMTFWRLQRLETLLLNDNRYLNGTIPTDLGAIVGLKRLELQNNKITGQLPTQLGNLVHLQTLNIAGNSIGNTVPADICQLRRDFPDYGLQGFESDCAAVSCTCCTSCENENE